MARKWTPVKHNESGNIPIYASGKPCPTPGKLSFTSRGDAKKYLRQRRSKPGSKVLIDSTLRVYRCACDHFHIGHQHTQSREELTEIMHRKLNN